MSGGVIGLTGRHRFRPGKRLWNWLITWPRREHWRRYVLGAALSLFAIWLALLTYLDLAPRVYTSGWSLILPGAGAGASVSIDSIGQASSIISSPFGSSSMSPKVLYQEIAATPRVRGRAAQILGISYEEFGEPRIKLVDQTSVMHFSISGRTPLEARAKGEAVLTALNEQLDKLRSDEISRRINAVQASLEGYRITLETARKRIVDLQRATGLVSIEQFNDSSRTIEDLRHSHITAQAALSRLESEQAKLRTQLGVSPSLASHALLLSGDQAFRQLVRQFANASAELADLRGRFGPNHPKVVRARALRQAVLSELQGSAGRVLGEDAAQWVDHIGLFEAPARAELFQRLITGDADLAGRRAEVKTLASQIEQMEEKISRRSGEAAELEDLQRDHLVAEAVFSSALARVDTHRADVFASYPLAQVLAEPNLPEAPSSPRPLFVCIGGILGSLFAFGAWTLAWLRQLFVLPRLKNT